MNQRVDAIFEDGVFRPETPVHIANGERVSLDIESKAKPTNDLNDIDDLLDIEYIQTCRQKVGHAPSLKEVRTVLSAFSGSLAERISEERDER